MAATDVALTDGWRCRSCGHPKLALCDCGCCAADEEAEFAEMLDNCGAAALCDGDTDAAFGLWDAADWHAAPSEGTMTARLLILEAAVARNGG